MRPSHSQIFLRQFTTGCTEFIREQIDVWKIYTIMKTKSLLLRLRQRFFYSLKGISFVHYILPSSQVRVKTFWVFNRRRGPTPLRLESKVQIRWVFLTVDLGWRGSEFLYIELMKYTIRDQVQNPYVTVTLIILTTKVLWVIRHPLYFYIFVFWH